MSFLQTTIRVLCSALLIWATAVAPIALINVHLVDHAARAATVGRAGTETQDLHTVGAALATRVSSDTLTRAWAESSTRVGRVPLSALRLAAAGMVTGLVLSLGFSFLAVAAVYRLARLMCRRRFLLLPVRERDRQRVAWRQLAIATLIACLSCMVVGFGVGWETGFAWAIDVHAGTICAAAIGTLSLALSVTMASSLVERSSRVGKSDSIRRWHCSKCGYEIGADIPLGCPECGAGVKEESVPVQVSGTLFLPRLRDMCRERPSWILTFAVMLMIFGGVQWTIRQAQSFRAAITGPLQIATRWQGVTRVRWEDGTQAVFAHGYFTETGPVMDSSQFSRDAYRRVATCAWTHPSIHGQTETWDTVHWVSPWFEAGVSPEMASSARHRVVLVSPGSGGIAGEAWLSPRTLESVEQFDEVQIVHDGVPAIVKRVWNDHKARALNCDK